jgi:CBS-domain-containing membrane protein
MRVQDWMTDDVRTCNTETSLNDAAYQMWCADCGILPVVSEDRTVVGMITDRDVCMAACLRGGTLKDLKVGDAMARTVFTCQPTDSIEDAIRCMADHQVRRVPVVDARGKLVGILAANDLARQIVGLADERSRTRLTPRFVEALASICETRATTEVPEPVPAPRGARQPATITG